MTTPALSSILTGLQLLNLDSVSPSDLLGVIAPCQNLIKSMLLHHEAAVTNNMVAFRSIATDILLHSSVSLKYSRSCNYFSKSLCD